MRRLYCIAGVLLLLALINPYAAKADTLISTWAWTGTVSSQAVSGTAAFYLHPDSGSIYDLVIILTDTSAVAPTTPEQMLTGVYFNVSDSGTPGAMKMSAATSSALGMYTAASQTSGNGTATNICAQGSSGTAPAPSCTTMVGGWDAAYMGGGLTPYPTDKWGIGTTTQQGLFSSTNVNIDDYGIAPSVGDGAISGSTPAVDSTATFTLYDLGPNTITGVTISNVVGVYGLGAANEEFPTPEPASVGTFAGGFALLALAWRRRRVR